MANSQDQKTGIQIKIIDGKIGICIGHIVLMLSVDDAKLIGHDLIVTASEIEKVKVN